MIGDVEEGNIRDEKVSLPDYIDMLSGNQIFIDYMQRYFIWLYRKAKKTKSIDALISKDVGLLTINKIFDDKYSEISQISMGEHRITRNLIQESRFHKIVSSIDKTFRNVRDNKLRGESINLANYYDKTILSIIDGNQRSTTLLLLFNGNLKNQDDKDYSPLMKICDINVQNNEIDKTKSVELTMKTNDSCSYDGQNGFLYFDKVDNVISCYVKLNYFYQRWKKVGSASQYDFTNNILAEINGKLNRNGLTIISDTTKSINIILDNLYDVFKKMNINLHIYIEPSLKEALKIFLNANNGIKLDDSDSMYAILTREAFYDSDARNKLEGTRKEINKIGFDFNEDQIFEILYYISNKKEGKDSDFPATMKTIYESYNNNIDVHKELSSKYSYYEEVLKRTLEIISRENIYQIIGKSVLFTRIIARRIRYLSDRYNSATYWSKTSNTYKTIEKEVLRFAALGTLNHISRNNVMYNMFRSHIDKGGALDTNRYIKEVEVTTATEYLTSVLRSTSAISKIMSALTSPSIDIKDVVHTDHFYAMKLFTNKKVDGKPIVANFICLGREDNTSKQDKEPYIFLSERSEDWRKRHLGYISGITETYVTDDKLKDLSYYSEWSKDMVNLKLKRLKELGIVKV